MNVAITFGYQRRNKFLIHNRNNIETTALFLSSYFYVASTFSTKQSQNFHFQPKCRYCIYVVVTIFFQCFLLLYYIYVVIYVASTLLKNGQKTFIFNQNLYVVSTFQFLSCFNVYPFLLYLCCCLRCFYIVEKRSKNFHFQPKCKCCIYVVVPILLKCYYSIIISTLGPQH